MSRLLFALALWMGMQAATAEAAPPGMPQAAPAAAVTAVSAAAGVMHVSLTLPEKEAKGTPTAPKTVTVAKPAEPKEADEEENQRPTTGAMLLAALLLMTGIALRRWGAGQQ